MKSILLFLAITFSTLNFTIDKTSFYNSLKSNSVSDLDKMILLVEKEKTTPLNRAYKGALIAKKAGFKKKVSEKIKLFKSGVILLEAELKKDTKNVEFRFLRLTIQENAPKILKYNTNIEEDISIIEKGFAQLNSTLKNIILNYAKDSKYLNSSKLK